MIYVCNKEQEDTLFFLIYFNNQPLHVSNGLTIHLQDVALLYMQHMLFTVHLRRLAASTIRVDS